MKHARYIPVSRGSAWLFLMCAAIAAGTAIGSVIAVSGKGTGYWLIHQYFLPQYAGNTVLAVLGNTFEISLICLAVSFFSGLSAFGQPVGAAILLYKGIGIGIAAAEMYTASGLAAAPAVITLLLPRALAESFVTILAVRELFRSSAGILRFLVSGDGRDNERSSLKMYCIKFAVLIFISFIISAADSLLYYIFAGLL